MLLSTRFVAFLAAIGIALSSWGTALAMDTQSWFFTTANDANPLPFSECVRRAPSAFATGTGFTPTQHGTNPLTFWGNNGTVSVTMMCIGESRGFYMVLDVVNTSGSATDVGNAINAAFWGTGGTTATPPTGNQWYINSNCGWPGGGSTWHATLTLSAASDGSLTGTVSNDNLGSNGILVVASDSNWPNGEGMQSRVSGSTLTLVLSPKSWESVLMLTGQWNGSYYSGTVHHYSSDDCTFTMSPFNPG